MDELITRHGDDEQSKALATRPGNHMHRMPDACVVHHHTAYLLILFRFVLLVMGFDYHFVS